MEKFQIIRVSMLPVSSKIKDFNCGNVDMDGYFHRYAKKNDKSHLSPCLCLVDESTHSIAAYMCLSSSSVKAENMVSVSTIKLPKYPVPVILLSRLAVSVHHQGKGFGQRMLMFAFHKLAKSVESGVGALGMLTQAVDKNAVTFYQRYDFRVLDPNSTKFPRDMFIHTQTILETI
jgi:GNAT superfamily N-acetyltransferase